MLLLCLFGNIAGFSQKSQLLGSWISDSTISNNYVGKEMVGFDIVDYSNVVLAFRIEFTPDYRIVFLIDRAKGTVESSNFDKIIYLKGKYALGEFITEYRILPSGQMWFQVITHEGNKTEVLECFYSRVK